MKLKAVNYTKHAVLGILLFGSANLAFAQQANKAAAAEVVQQSNPTIEALKKQIASNPQDNDALVKLATAYQEIKDWKNALDTWKKVETNLPDWAPLYYSEGYVYQNLKDNEGAKNAYNKYISLVKPEEIEANKKNLAYSYLFIAFTQFETNKEEAKKNIAKSLEYDPTNEDAQKLNKQLNP